MIQSNSFALFRGVGALDEAVKAVKAVDRHHDRVLVDDGSGLEEVGGAGARSGSEIAVVSLARGGGDSYPLVHGFMEGSDTATSDARHSGEFAFLTEGGGSFTCGRDVMGTRPLYVRRGGVSCLTSDHRFAGQGPVEMLAPGAVYSGDGRPIARWDLTPEPAEAKSVDEAAQRLAALLTDSVRRRVIGKKVAVSFSGGLDSSVIALCASKSSSVILCSAFVKGSRDEVAARRAADALGLPLVSGELDGESAKRELAAMSLPFEPSRMDKALWCIYSTTSRLANDSGAEVILLGQLADELFGGYMKYSIQLHDLGAEKAVESMKRDVIGASKEGFVRDEMACARWLEPRFPFADEKVAAFGLGLPLSYKIRDGGRKVVLRKAASLMGLPEKLVEAPKKAAQYSSGALKLVG